MKSVKSVAARVLPTTLYALPATLRDTVNTYAARGRDKVYKNIWRIL